MILHFVLWSVTSKRNNFHIQLFFCISWLQKRRLLLFLSTYLGTKKQAPKFIYIYHTSGSSRLHTYTSYLRFIETEIHTSSSSMLLWNTKTSANSFLLLLCRHIYENRSFCQGNRTSILGEILLRIIADRDIYSRWNTTQNRRGEIYLF